MIDQKMRETIGLAVQTILTNVLSTLNSMPMSADITMLIDSVTDALELKQYDFLATGIGYLVTALKQFSAQTESEQTAIDESIILLQPIVSIANYLTSNQSNRNPVELSRMNRWVCHNIQIEQQRLSDAVLKYSWISCAQPTLIQLYQTLSQISQAIENTNCLPTNSVQLQRSSRSAFHPYPEPPVNQLINITFFQNVIIYPSNTVQNTALTNLLRPSTPPRPGE